MYAEVNKSHVCKTCLLAALQKNQKCYPLRYFQFTEIQNFIAKIFLTANNIQNLGLLCLQSEERVDWKKRKAESK